MSLKSKRCCSRSSLKLTAALVLVGLLAGCTPSRSPGPAPLRVGVALYTQNDTFIATIAKKLEQIALETEQEEKFQINLSILDGRSNQTAQLEQIDQLLDKGCGVLCVNIVDRTTAAVIIDKAEKAQVPVIFFNRQPVSEDISRWEQVYYVGASARESGLLQGEIVLRAWKEHRAELDRNGDGVLQYVVLEGEPGHQDALLRTEYATKPLTDAGVPLEKLASATGNWNRGQAAARTEQWIRELGGQVEVIFSNNDDMALGAIDTYQASGAAPLPLVVGVDATDPALEAVAAGTLYGTVRNDADGMAQTMMELALALYKGEDPAQAVALTDGHYVWLPYRPVTRENLAEFTAEQAP